MTAVRIFDLAALNDIIRSKVQDVMLQNSISKHGDGDKEYYINVFHFVIGSKVYESDFTNPENPYPRNHEAPTIVKNLIHTPGNQLAPNIVEMLVNEQYKRLNINQILILIDPRYRDDNKLTGLQSVFPIFETSSILAVSGYVNDSTSTPIIPYNSILEPIVITDDITELQVKAFIGSSLYIPSVDSKDPSTCECTNILVNVMDCTSHVMRHTWVNNNHPLIYQAMPDCFTIDSTPQYMPIITFSSIGEYNIRWCNWKLDKELIPVYQLTSPTTYRFLITNYWREIMDIYMIGFTKLASRMKVSREYVLPDNTRFSFNMLSMREFCNYWQDTQRGKAFQDFFMSYLDGFFAHNIRKFIDIITGLTLSNEDDYKQPITVIAMKFLEWHVAELNQLAIGCDSIPPFQFTHDIPNLQSRISEYLNASRIYL